jgi:hypothetical protein
MHTKFNIYICYYHHWVDTSAGGGYKLVGVSSYK